MEPKWLVWARELQAMAWPWSEPSKARRRLRSGTPSTHTAISLPCLQDVLHLRDHWWCTVSRFGNSGSCLFWSQSIARVISQPSAPRSNSPHVCSRDFARSTHRVRLTVLCSVIPRKKKERQRAKAACRRTCCLGCLASQRRSVRPARRRAPAGKLYLTSRHRHPTTRSTSARAWRLFRLQLVTINQCKAHRLVARCWPILGGVWRSRPFRATVCDHAGASWSLIA